MNTPIDRVLARTERSESCWEWQGATDSNGYGRISVGGRAAHKMEGAHRITFEHYNGPIPKGSLVLHRCDNRRCVRPDHLFLGTHADNMRDMAMKGRSRTTKLTADQVIEIRKRASEPRDSLAAEFGIAKSNVGMILTQQTWRHLPTVRDLLAIGWAVTS